MDPVLDHLTFLYGPERAPAVRAKLQAVMDRYPQQPAVDGLGLGPGDALLISYGDQVRAEGERPLHTLRVFCEQHLTGLVSGVHILPFFPWTSDDGFSVVDYRAIDPALGTWDDVRAFPFRMMYDAVINHISAESTWFKGFLRDDPPYREYFVTVEGSPDLSSVVRPRALPLLTPFTTPSGVKQVWTTFSPDQIDLNFANPAVLLEILDLALFYATQGAEFLRLDAIAFMWKEIGSPCVHLPQTHRIIQLMRAVLDQVAPRVKLITETNVPHHFNISYFGDGHNEAQLVYNFALPPLTVHALQTGCADTLREWARSLSCPSQRTTFFNFLASHDGIGLNPARGILPETELEAMTARVRSHGGLASLKDNGDGTQSVYELNVSFFDALSNPHAAEPLTRQVDRFMCAQAIMLAMVGLPGIYFHSLFGSRSWAAGVAQTGRSRTINRQKFERAMLERDLADPGSVRAQVFARYARLLRQRAAQPAFDPLGDQAVLDAGPAILALLRTAGNARALCLHNVSDAPQPVRLPGTWPGLPETLQPYEVAWLPV